MSELKGTLMGLFKDFYEETMRCPVYWALFLVGLLIVNETIASNAASYFLYTFGVILGYIFATAVLKTVWLDPLLCRCPRKDN